MSEQSDLEGIGWVLWSGTIGMASTVPDRVEAAHAAGCARLSIGPLDVLRVAQDGMSPGDLGRSLRDAGLDVVMDPLLGWYGDEPLPGPYASLTVEDIVRMCEALHVVAISSLGPFHADEARVEDLGRAFAKLCDRGASLGAQVQLEFMPFTAVRDLTAAWAIVEAADRANAGILFDTWHFFRGDADLSAIDRVPGHRIFAVQVADAPAEASGDLTEETFNRMLPGDGGLDLASAIRSLDRIGALSWVGPEVISPHTAAMPPADAARLAGKRVRDLIGSVRLESRTS